MTLKWDKTTITNKKKGQKTFNLQRNTLKEPHIVQIDAKGRGLCFVHVDI